jgi:hypothetical protein
MQETLVIRGGKGELNFSFDFTVFDDIRLHLEALP